MLRRRLRRSTCGPREGLAQARHSRQQTIPLWPALPPLLLSERFKEVCQLLNVEMGPLWFHTAHTYVSFSEIFHGIVIYFHEGAVAGEFFAAKMVERVVTKVAAAA